MHDNGYGKSRRCPYCDEDVRPGWGAMRQVGGKWCHESCYQLARRPRRDKYRP